MSRHKYATNVPIDSSAQVGGDVIPVFNEKDIAKLYEAKCKDLSIKMYPTQFMRFRDNLNLVCVNRKCNLSDMHLGTQFVMQLR